MPFFNRRTGWSKKVNTSFRSGFEEKVMAQLKDAGVKAEYETCRVDYTTPPVLHHYTPDFILPNGIIVETKGLFSAADRKKHLLIKKQNPDLDIRFVFQNPKNKLSRASKTTYAAWCEKNGFLWAKEWVPASWIKEKNRKTPGLYKKETKK